MTDTKSAPIEDESSHIPEEEAGSVEKLAEVTGEEISNTESKVHTIMTVGEQPEGHNLVETSAAVVSLAPVVIPDKDIVKVKIEYPAKYKGPKFFKDGDIKEVHQSVADQFVNKLKIGTLVDVEDKKTV